MAVEYGSGFGTDFPNDYDVDNQPEINSPNPGKTKPRAELFFDTFAMISALQHNIGLNAQGSLSNIGARLDVSLNADGTIKTSVFSLSKNVREELSAKNGGNVTITVGVVSVITVTTSAASVGDRILINAFARMMKGATAGIGTFYLDQNGGTGVGKFYHDLGSGNGPGQSCYQPVGENGIFQLSALFRVTSAGTFTFRLSGSSSGSNGTVFTNDGQIFVTVYK